MKRLLLIGREKKTRVLIAVAALTIAVLAAVGSGAWFTARTDPQEATVTAGSMAVSGDGFTLVADNMAPGDSESGQITITNGGSLPGKLAIAINDYTASEMPGMTSTGGPGSVLSENLDITIEDESSNVLYEGSLTDLTVDDYTQVKDSVTLDPGATRTYTFTVHLRNNDEPADPETGDNVYQQASSTFPFTWEIHSQELPSP